MKRTKAKNLLQKQIDKLIKFENPEDYDIDWKVQTTAYIKIFFGENSPQFKRIRDDSAKNKGQSNLVSFLMDCIDTITSIGLYKEPKKNILSKVSNLKLLTFAIIIFTTGLTWGVWLGENKLIRIFTVGENSANKESNAISNDKDNDYDYPMTSNHYLIF